MSVFTLVDGLLSDAAVTRGYTRPVVLMLEQEVLAVLCFTQFLHRLGVEL